MPAVTIRNLSDEAHLAPKARAAQHGRSTEAEMRDILEATVRPTHRVKLGTLLASIGREAGLAESEMEPIDRLRGQNLNRADELRVILLDTDVASEPLRPAADPRVLARIDAQAIETLYMSAITVAELRFGIAATPPG